MTLLPTHCSSPGIDLTGRVALVTGGANGIGWACLEALRTAGAQVIAADLLGQENRSSPPGDGVHRVACDVSEEASVKAVFEEVLRTYGQLDVLVNSAGVIEAVKRSVDQEVDDWNRVMSVNARGTFLCCREAGRAMVPRRSGAIVNIGSVAGLLAIPGSNAYGPSKAAVTLMTQSLAGEWARFGIRVNCVAPGYIDTAMSRHLFADEPSAVEAALKRVPMSRMGRTEEIAQAVLFLCSPMASYVTGAVLAVDGGWSAFGGPGR